MTTPRHGDRRPLTTATVGAAAVRAATRAIVGIGAGLLVLATTPSARASGRGAVAAIAVLAAIGTAIWIAPALLRSIEGAGSWTLDDTGFVHRPMNGVARSVRWTDVRAVRPRPGGLLVRDGAGSVPLGSPLLAGADSAHLVRTASDALGLLPVSTPIAGRRHLLLALASGALTPALAAWSTGAFEALWPIAVIIGCATVTLVIRACLVRRSWMRLPPER